MPAVLLVLAVVCVGVWLLLGAPMPGAPAPAVPTSGEPSSGRPTTGQPGQGEAARPADAFELVVDHVYDGDTIRATVLSPNDVVPTTDPVRVRLIGIDTPEGTPTVECWADEARAHLSELLPDGSRVWAAVDRDPQDRYGRYLFYLWTDDGVFVNHELVASGDAVAIRVAPNDAHIDLLRDAQRQAERDGLGQWGAC
jgi:micrococcal nuclease